MRSSLTDDRLPLQPERSRRQVVESHVSHGGRQVGGMLGRRQRLLVLWDMLGRLGSIGCRWRLSRVLRVLLWVLLLLLGLLLDGRPIRSVLMMTGIRHGTPVVSHRRRLSSDYGPEAGLWSGAMCSGGVSARDCWERPSPKVLTRYSIYLTSSCGNTRFNQRMARLGTQGLGLVEVLGIER